MILKRANIYKNGGFEKCDFEIGNSVFDNVAGLDGIGVFLNDLSKMNNLYIFPGFIDVHVHLREPGFFYKESIKSGSFAAARGGYTTVCAMPNLNPVPDTLENLNIERKIIKKGAVINVIPYGAVTMGENGEVLSEMEKMKDYVIGFSDDGKGVQNAEIMEQAMLTAKRCGKIISAHCEDNSLLNGGYIHKGKYAEINGHRGISSESEYLPVKRDLELVRKTGCKYHVCHISCKESVELLRNAKKEGLDVSCETAPHYLLLDDMCLKDEGRFKMNPPIRDISDKEALIEGILDGTVDMIATDHAPHGFDEKNRGLEKSLMGISGIETAFPLMYTNFVKTGIFPLEFLIKLMYENPKKRFNIAQSDDCFTVFDLDKEYKINSENFLSKGKATPFDGDNVFGECVLTAANGKTAWIKGADRLRGADK